MSDEHSGDALENGGSVHVHRGSDGKDETADVFVHTVVLLDALYHRGKGRWTEEEEPLAVILFYCGWSWEESVPGAGGERCGERRYESRQETVGVFSRQAEVDERQDEGSVNNVSEDRGEDVLSQTGDQQDDVFHLHDLTADQEHDAERDVPETTKRRVLQSYSKDLSHKKKKTMRQTKIKPGLEV